MDILPAFTFARAIVNLWSTFLGVKISRLEWSETLATQAMWAMSKGSPFVVYWSLRFFQQYRLFYLDFYF